MKKILLLTLSLLFTVVAQAATTFGDGSSTYELSDDGTLTISVAASGDLSSLSTSGFSSVTAVVVTCADDVALSSSDMTFFNNLCNYGTTVKSIDLYNASFGEDASACLSAITYAVCATVLLPSGVSVSEAATNTSNNWNTNFVSINGTTATAYVKNAANLSLALLSNHSSVDTLDFYSNNYAITVSDLTLSDLPSNITTIDYSNIYAYNFNGTTLTLDNNYVTKIIYNGASGLSLDFSGCTALTSLDLSGTIASLDLSGCTGLTSLTLSDVTINGNINLNGCTNLTTVDISGCTIDSSITITVYESTEGAEGEGSAISGLTTIYVPTGTSNNITVTPTFTVTEKVAAANLYTLHTNRACYVKVELSESGQLRDAVQSAKDSGKINHDSDRSWNKLTEDEDYAICVLIVTGELNEDDVAYLNSDEVNAKDIVLEKATVAEGVTFSMANNTSVQSLVLPNCYATADYLAGADTCQLDTLVLPTSSSAFLAAAAYTKEDSAAVAYVNQRGNLWRTTRYMSDMGSKDGDGSGLWAVSAANVKSIAVAGNVLPNDVALGNSMLINQDSKTYYLSSDGHIAISDSTTSATPTGDTYSVNYYAYASADLTPVFPEAFVGATVSNVSTLNLHDAVFEEKEGADNNDLCISLLGYSGNHLTSLTLPVSAGVTRIAPFCLQTFHSMKELCIPANFKYIGKYAFQNSDISHFYTTKLDTDTDIDSTALDHGDCTITLPPHLKFIGTGAFVTTITNYAYSDNEKTGNGYTDVYSLNPEAPVCQHDAFGSTTTYGDNGYNNSRPVQRSNYGFAILHYPSTTSVAEMKNYEDVDRDYSFPDETLATDGNGKIINWPNQSEFARSYNQAIHHYTWNAWKSYRQSPFDTGTGDYTKVDLQNTNIIYSGNLGNGRDSNSTYERDSLTVEYGDDDFITDSLGASILENTYKPKTFFDYENYMGWHEFVMTETFYEAGDEEHEYNYDLSGIKDNDWWTICVPFDMTRQEVGEYFGKVPVDEDGNPIGDWRNMKIEQYPIVTTLNGVVRNDSVLVLQFPENLMNGTLEVFDEVDGAGTDNTLENKDKVMKHWAYTENTTTSDDDIIIHAGFPYLIKPYLPEATLNNIGNIDRVFRKTITGEKLDNRFYTKYSTSSEGFNYYDDGYKVSVRGRKARTTVIDNADTTDYAKVCVSGDSVPAHYTFIGTQVSKAIPRYSYFLGYNGAVNFFYMDETDKTTTGWNNGTAVVALIKNAKISASAGGSHMLYLTCYEDALSSTTTTEETQAAKGLTVQLDFSAITNSTVDGITEIKVDEDDDTIVLNGELVQGNVYNVNGQYLGTSLRGLPKGIYISGGRKFAVK